MRVTYVVRGANAQVVHTSVLFPEELRAGNFWCNDLHLRGEGIIHLTVPRFRVLHNDAAASPVVPALRPLEAGSFVLRSSVS
jgi:hypothetical protein